MIRRLLFGTIRHLVDLSERWYGFSPVDHWRCEGRADGLRFAAGELRHFAWGHPEIDMRGAARAMEQHAADWEPSW